MLFLLMFSNIMYLSYNPSVYTIIFTYIKCIHACAKSRRLIRCVLSSQRRSQTPTKKYTVDVHSKRANHTELRNVNDEIMMTGKRKKTTTAKATKTMTCHQFRNGISFRSHQMSLSSLKHLQYLSIACFDWRKVELIRMKVLRELLYEVLRAYANCQP